MGAAGGAAAPLECPGRAAAIASATSGADGTGGPALTVRRGGGGHRGTCTWSVLGPVTWAGSATWATHVVVVTATAVADAPAAAGGAFGRGPLCPRSGGLGGRKGRPVTGSDTRRTRSGTPTALARVAPGISAAHSYAMCGEGGATGTAATGSDCRLPPMVCMC